MKSLNGHVKLFAPCASSYPINYHHFPVQRQSLIQGTKTWSLSDELNLTSSSRESRIPVLFLYVLQVATPSADKLDIKATAPQRPPRPSNFQTRVDQQKASNQ